MKTTKYFDATRQRADRAGIDFNWIQYVMEHPQREEVQQDGRIRRWARIEGADNKILRVVWLPHGETIHNAFFDRRSKP